MIRYAESFITVAEELNFGAAAARLKITQPALSYQIKKLEETLGVELFKRSSRGVALTEAGAVLAAEFSTSLERMRRAAQIARDTAQGATGKLVIGYCELPDSGNMISSLRRYRAAYPNVELELINIMTVEQPEALARGLIDVAFIHPPIHLPGFDLYPVGEEPIVAALHSQHPLLLQNSIELADLRHEVLIVCAESIGPFLFHSVLNACEQARFTPRIRQEQHRWHSMLDQAAAQLGVALVPQSLAPAAHRHLCFRPVAGLEVTIKTAVAVAQGPVRKVVADFVGMATALGPE